MPKKKVAEIRVGSRVRVADPLATGDERWTEALHGVVQSAKDRGVLVLLDGETRADFHLWTDVDVEHKPRPQLLELALIEIHPSRWQYRRRWDAAALLELARSIEDHGLVNRLLVFRDEEGGCELIAGERRLRASWAIALHRAGQFPNLAAAVEYVAAPDWWLRTTNPTLAIPTSEIVPAGEMLSVELRAGDAADFREIVILENLQRSDPTAVEEAEAFHLLIQEEGYTQQRLAERLGKSQSYISQRLALLGLSEETRQAVESQAISATAARAIASLPAAVQGAVTAHVQEMQKGDQASTTRKVQTMAAQFRKFLDPTTWLPPEGLILPPSTRNRLRLIHHVIVSADQAQLGPAVVALRAGSLRGQPANLTGRDPLTIASENYPTDQIVQAITGHKTSEYPPYPPFDYYWQRTAVAQGWTCTHCQFHPARAPEDKVGDAICARWDTNHDDVPTCENYIGPDDPVIIPLEGNKRLVDKLQRDDQVVKTPFPHMTDVEQFVEFLEDAAVALGDEKALSARAGAQAHLPMLRAYWEAQNAGDNSLFGGMQPADAQYHRCDRCLNYRPDLLEQNLPPCRYSVEPLRENNYSEGTRAPGMGVLINKYGLMVLRCEMFRVRDMPQLTAGGGWKLAEGHGGRHSVMGWMRAIVSSNQIQNHDHYSTVMAPLSWLPYPRAEGRHHDTDALIDWLWLFWRDTGDDQYIARLLDIAVSEANACRQYEGTKTFYLTDVNTGDEWAATSLQTVLENRSRDNYWYPKDWPQPWIKEQK